MITMMGFYENILWKPAVKRGRGGWDYVVKCSHYMILHCNMLTSIEMFLTNHSSYLAIIVFIKISHEDIPPVAHQFPPASAGGIFIVFMLLQFDLHSWRCLASRGELAVSGTSTLELSQSSV